MALEFLIVAAGVPLATWARVKWDHYGSAGAWLRVVLASLAVGIPAGALAAIVEDPAPLDIWGAATFLLFYAAPWFVSCALLLRWLLRPIKQAEEI